MDVVEAFLRAHGYIYESKPINAAIYKRRLITRRMALPTLPLSQGNPWLWKCWYCIR
jgi:hypothetical protein